MQLFIAEFREGLPSGIAQELESSSLVASTFPLTDKSILIRSYASNPQQLSDIAGFGGDDPKKRAGVVFRLNGFYYGFFDKSLWDWLEEART